MNNFWLKKTGWFAGIFLLVLLFSLNTGQIYEVETDVLLLPKNETSALSLDATIDNFRQVLKSLAFNDRIAEGNDALEEGLELPNYKRKEFWNSKLSITRVDQNGVIAIKNFDKNGLAARELNEDTVENLIAVAGSYYNIENDLEIRIIDGPIARKVVSRNLYLTLGQSLIWSLGIYFILFFIFPFVFTKKEKSVKREIPGRNFSQKVSVPKMQNLPTFPAEENYFATKNFFEKVNKTGELKEASEVKNEVLQKNEFSLPSFPSFSKKAPTPQNLPVSEEDVPDIFLKKEVINTEKIAETIKDEKIIQKEYISREATPEEVKAKLNRLLSGGR